MAAGLPEDKEINERLNRLRPSIIAVLQAKWPQNHQADIEDAIHDAILKTTQLREFPEDDLFKYLIVSGHNNLITRQRQERRHQSDLKLSEISDGERNLVHEAPEIFATGPAESMERAEIESILLWLTTDAEPLTPTDRAAKAYKGIRIASEQKLTDDQRMVFNLLLRQKLKCNKDIAAHALVQKPPQTISDWRRRINEIVSDELAAHGYDPQLFREL